MFSHQKLEFLSILTEIFASSDNFYLLRLRVGGLNNISVLNYEKLYKRFEKEMPAKFAIQMCLG